MRVRVTFFIPMRRCFVPSYSMHRLQIANVFCLFIVYAGAPIGVPFFTPCSKFLLGLVAIKRTAPTEIWSGS
jgi:hypothetical protein